MALNRSLTMERDKAVKQLQEQKDGEQQRISQAVLEATEGKDKTIRLLQGALKNSKRILSLIADMLYHASEVFKRAVMAIIHFGTEQHKSVFAPSEAADIKSVMAGIRRKRPNNKNQSANGFATMRKATAFDEIKHRQTRNEIAM